MKYLFLFIRICVDIVLRIKLNIKRNWKYLKRAFKKEPILYKRSKVFRKNFVKYTRLYKGVTEEKKLIELKFIEQSEMFLDMADFQLLHQTSSFHLP